MWRKIVSDPELENAVTEKLYEIYSIHKQYETENISLLDGLMGPILFKTYYGKFQKDNSIIEESISDMEVVFSQMDNIKDLTLSMGFAGILFVLDHLDKGQFIEFEEGFLDFDIDIFSKAIRESKDLDYLHGISGIILSFIENKNYSRFNAYFEQWINLILLTKESSEDELKWKRSLEQPGGIFKDVYCLGLAHGTPSIILILLKVYKRTNNQKVRELLHKAAKFLFRSRFKEENDFFFPNSFAEGYETPSRLAWCYGDLGCAMSLYLYGRHFNDKSMIDFSNRVFLKHCQKRDVLKYRVTDPGFCHGSIGIAHFYGRMFNYTGLEIYRETSEYWVRATLEKATYMDGLAGYKHYAGPDKGFINSYGLLEGVSGIGLSLISSITDDEPKWDSCLLYS